MKKFVFAISALSVLLLGCSKEQNTVDTEEINPQVEEGTVFSFDAVIEQAVDPDATRATINPSGEFSWTGSEEIAVQLTNNNFKTFTYDSEKGKFVATLSNSEAIKDGGVAYYPASIAINGTPGSVNFTAGIQSGNPSGFPMKATISLSDYTLSFTHLGGFVKLAVSRIPKDATLLKFEASGVTLSGTFAVSSDQISATTSGNTSLSYAVSESTSSAEFTVLVPVTTFSGFTMKFLNASDEVLYSKSTAKSISVGRARMKSMAQVTVPVSLYINTCAAWWDDTQQRVYVADASSEYSGWPGTAFNVDDNDKTFTHSGNKFNRVIEDLGSMTGKTAARIVIHRNWNNSNEAPYGDLYRATLVNVDLSSDVYVTLSNSTSTTHKVYVCTYSGEYYNVWAWYTTGTSGNVFTGNYPGPVITSLSYETLGDHDYHYFEIREDSIGIKCEARYGMDGNYSAQTSISVANGYDYFVVLKNEEGAWSTAYYRGFPALIISED